MILLRIYYNDLQIVVGESMHFTRLYFSLDKCDRPAWRLDQR